MAQPTATAPGPPPSAASGARPTEQQIEAELRRVGGTLAHAFPSAARHPIKAIDSKAMQLSSADAELKAALFRFVDVTPACRSLDDLARHLEGLLGEVDRPAMPLRAAMALAHTRVGRKALGIGAGVGVRHMAHRFIVGESPSAALGALSACGSPAPPPRSTCWERRRSRRARATTTPGAVARRWR